MHIAQFAKLWHINLLNDIPDRMIWKFTTNEIY
jgi:hypothetical protein